jgi:hypothetical protein
MRPRQGPAHSSARSLHPQAQLATGSACCDPVQRRMELGHRRHRSNTFTTELRKLFTLRSVKINEAIHVPNAKALYTVLGKLLPLGT